MNIFWHELKSSRNATLIWSFSLAFMVILFLSLYPSFTKDIDASQKILENLPIALREAFGISLSNFFTIFGFFSYLFTFVMLAGAIQAMNLGVGMISEENRSKTADFLLAKPVHRSFVVSQKLLAAIMILLITNIIFTIATFAASLAVSTKSFDVATFLLITSSLLLVQLVFLALGTLLAVIIPKIKSTIAISLPVTFALYIIGALGAIIGDNTVKYLTPFKFYDPNYIIQHNHYEWKFVIVEVIFVILSITFTYVIYNKKDIQSAT